MDRELPYLPELMLRAGAIIQALKHVGRSVQRVQVPVSTPDQIVLHLDGDYSRIAATLCSHCPRGPAGCCTEPPSYWPSDIALLVLTGQGDWLLEQVRLGNLVPREGDPSELQPITSNGACTYWQSGRGCSLPAQRRPPYCNHYICGEALEGLGITRELAQAIGDVGLDPIRALREYYWQRRHWLSAQIAAEMQCRGEWPLRWDHPKRARRRLDELARVARPLLATCLAPKGMRVVYAASQGGTQHGSGK